MCAKRIPSVPGICARAITFPRVYLDSAQHPSWRQALLAVDAGASPVFRGALPKGPGKQGNEYSMPQRSVKCKVYVPRCKGAFSPPVA